MEREETTNPGQRKISAPTVFAPYIFLPGPERMRHLCALQLNVTLTHHLEGTHHCQTRSDQRTNVLSLNSVAEQMQEIS